MMDELRKAIQHGMTYHSKDSKRLVKEFDASVKQVMDFLFELHNLRKENAKLKAHIAELESRRCADCVHWDKSEYLTVGGAIDQSSCVLCNISDEDGSCYKFERKDK
jgi:hypothetical protein